MIPERKIALRRAYIRQGEPQPKLQHNARKDDKKDQGKKILQRKNYGIHTSIERRGVT